MYWNHSQTVIWSHKIGRHFLVMPIVFIFKGTSYYILSLKAVKFHLYDTVTFIQIFFGESCNLSMLIFLMYRHSSGEPYLDGRV